MSTVKKFKNTYPFGILIWEVLHKSIILLPREKMEKKALEFNYKPIALIWSWFM